MPGVYYNEHDPKASAWLRELIKAGHLPAGDVDERDVQDVLPTELVGYAQCHFFAGIGGWPYALRLSDWPDDRPVWTGSCPCQPFSAAGPGTGVDDERHLWPAFRWLIDQCRPAVVFGEQVASADGRAWLAGVRSDLETMAYRVGAADLCAAGAGEEAEGRLYRGDQEVGWMPIVLGAPNIRQRLFWVAYADRPGQPAGCGTVRAERGDDPRRGGASQRLADSEEVGRRCGAGLRDEGPAEHGRHVAPDSRQHGGLGDTGSPRPSAREREDISGTRRREERGAIGEPSGSRSSFWTDFDVLPCTDGRARRVEPGSFPLAHGIPARMGRLRGYGNAINPEVAVQFIQAAEHAAMTSPTCTTTKTQTEK